MSLARLTFLFLSLSLSLSLPFPLHADPPGARSAPYLGTDNYTIHFAGIVKDALPEIRKLTGHTVMVEAGVKDDAPVALDFDNANLGEIILDLCQQTGLVYEVRGNGGPIQLRKGDVRCDARPTAELEDFLVRVMQVRITNQRQQDFHWGQRAPDDAQYVDQMQVMLEVSARSPEGAAAMAGLDTTARVITDTGVALPTQTPGTDPLRWWSGPNPGTMMFTASLTFPPPPEKATSLARLEGNLRVYSQVKTTELVIKPDSQALQQDDVNGALKSWQQDERGLTVSVDLTIPPLVAPVPGQPAYMALWPMAQVVCRDGKVIATGGASSWSGQNSSYHFSFSFPAGVLAAGRTGELNWQAPPAAAVRLVPAGNGGAPVPGPAQVDHLKLTILRRGPVKLLPFVIQNIALP